MVQYPIWAQNSTIRHQINNLLFQQTIRHYHIDVQPMVLKPDPFWNNHRFVVRFSAQSKKPVPTIKVIFCQKHSCLHQLTQTMTPDCLWNYKFCTRKFQVQYMLRTSNCSECQNKKTFNVHNMCWTCNFLVLNSYFIEQSIVKFWVNWCKNECFWQKK